MLWYRVAHPYVAANSVIYSLKTLAPPACAGRRSFSACFSNIMLPGFNPRELPRKVLLNARYHHEGSMRGCDHLMGQIYA